MKLSLLLLFWSLWYLAFSSRAIISPLLPLLQSTLQVSQATAGGLFLFMAGGSTLAVSLAGHIALKIGYKRLILISFSVLAAALIGFSRAQGYWTIGMIMLFIGMASGLYLPCAVPMLTAAFEPKHWGKAIGFHETAAGFSILAAPFVVALLIGVVQWRTIFLLLAAVTALIAIIFWRTTPNPAPERRRSVPLSVLFKRTDFWIIMLLWVSCGMLSMGIYNIIPLFLVNEKGMPLEQANRIFSLSRFGGFLGQVVIGFFLDRLSTRKLLCWLTAAGGLFTLAMALIQTHWLLVIVLLLQGTFCVVFFPVGIVAIAKVGRPEERGVITGTIMAVSGMLAIGVTPFLLGAVADRWSFQAGFTILGILTLAISPLAQRLRSLS
jgi:NNP family nitrate/nitrite transporter-like MFS transporter